MHRHIVQFYADGAYMAKRAAAFLDEALAAGGSAVVIASGEHQQGISDAMTISGGRLVVADADETLAAFMDGDMPDRDLFEAAVGKLLGQAGEGGNGQIHAFGEMVALLWERGQHAAAIRLEQLWEQVGSDDRVSLLCAYPISSFADSRHTNGFLRICQHHHESYPTERMDAGHAQIAHVEQQAWALAGEVQRREAAERLVADVERQGEEFLAALGHELRNPLTPLVASLRLLDDASAEEKDRLLELLRRQTDRLQQLVDDFLGSHRHGHLKVDRRPTTLGAVLDAARAMVRPHITTKDQALLLDLPAEPVCLDADPQLLAQVFGNLLANASRFTPPGGSISLQARLAGADVEIAVADTGIGIHPDRLDAIFGPFVTGGREAGLGLGLATVRRIVELHWGEVQAESAGHGRGATFRIRLPRKAHAVAHHAEAARRVLVVDDQPDVAHTIRDFLRLNGHEALAALSGPAAIEAAKARPPDIVLLDLSMPGMDGYETARALRREPRLAQTAIIALTGHTQPRHVEAARAAGCDHHVAKPPDPDALLRLVAEPRPMQASA